MMRSISCWYSGEHLHVRSARGYDEVLSKYYSTEVLSILREVPSSFLDSVQHAQELLLVQSSAY